MTLRLLGFSSDVTWKDFWTERPRLSCIYIMLTLVGLMESPGALAHAALKKKKHMEESREVRNNLKLEHFRFPGGILPQINSRKESGRGPAHPNQTSCPPPSFLARATPLDSPLPATTNTWVPPGIPGAAGQLGELPSAQALPHGAMEIEKPQQQPGAPLPATTNQINTAPMRKGNLSATLSESISCRSIGGVITTTLMVTSNVQRSRVKN